jgi:hypothetical protein
VDAALEMILSERFKTYRYARDGTERSAWTDAFDALTPSTWNSFRGPTAEEFVLDVEESHDAEPLPHPVRSRAAEREFRGRHSHSACAGLDPASGGPRRETLADGRI